MGSFPFSASFFISTTWMQDMMKFFSEACADEADRAAFKDLADARPEEESIIYRQPYSPLQRVQPYSVLKPPPPPPL